MDIAKEIYAGGFYSLSLMHKKKQQPFLDADKMLPGADSDLCGLKSKIVSPTAGTPEDFVKGDIRAKRVTLQEEFSGQSELLLLHALVIAVLRRRNPPEAAGVLFLRMWGEHGRYLADNLTIRWKISAATTFADHGGTVDQRVLGMGLSVLFDTIKMHDSERRMSGQSGRKPFKRDANTRLFPLAFGMEPYSMKKGDLDRNMLARLWDLAERDEVIFPLARAMLFQIMGDKRSIFARLQRIKSRRSNVSILGSLKF